MRKRWFLIPLSLAAVVACRADSVTLVTGEKVSGTIKEQTDTEVTIEVPISATITDERVIRKEDIAKIDKAQPDALAYQSLRLLEPNEQLSYAPDTYDQILQSLRAFETNFPNSPYLPEIKQKEAVFETEREKVKTGEVKFLGRWLTKGEATRRQIQILGLEALRNMNEQAKAGDLMGAMLTFDALEKSYGATRSYPSAVTLALQVLPGLQQQLAARAQAIVADAAQLKQTVLATPEPAKTNLINSVKMEQARNDAIVQASIRAGAKWVPLIPRSELSISTLQKTAATEASRLAAVPVRTMTLSIARVDAAREAISAGDFKTAAAALAQASQLWSQNEAAHYWTDRLKEKMATPTPSPTPAKPKPSVSPTPRPALAQASPSPSASPAVAAAALPPPSDKPFLGTPVGMASTGLVVLLLAAWGFSMIQKRGAAPQGE